MLPKRMYYVKLEYGEGSKLGYGEKKSGKYTDYNHAVAAYKSFKDRGIDCRLLMSQPLVWTEVTP